MGFELQIRHGCGDVRGQGVSHSGFMDRFLRIDHRSFVVHPFLFFAFVEKKEKKKEKEKNQIGKFEIKTRRGRKHIGRKQNKILVLLYTAR